MSNVRNSRKGVAAIYLITSMVALAAFCSLAVDFGRVQLAKTELRRAADGAARAGAAGIPVDAAEALRLTKLFASKNTVDGTSLTLLNSDIELGKWSTSARTFQITSDPSLMNAVHVKALRGGGRGDGIPMLFASLIGFKNCNVTAEAIVMVIPPVNVDQYVPATANPFLAGAAYNTVASRNNPHASPDYAGTTSNPRQSPLAVNMPVTGNDTYNFDSISGTARHDPSLSYYEPDGELGDIGHNINSTDGSAAYNNRYTNENGIADMKAPINALVGVFLSDEDPAVSSAPANLDFSTDASRDFKQLKPELKQIFFIGDGLDSHGNKQDFVAPAGATRLYLATWDFYEWNNNAGYRNIKVLRPMKIITVK